MTPEQRAAVAYHAAALFLLALCLGAPRDAAQCQEPNAPRPSQSLASALQGLRWDASQGALLAIEPETVLPLPGAPADGPNALRSVAARFDRKAVTVGGVTVLAPRTMVVLNEDLGEPTPGAAMNRVDRLRALLGSLDTDQWRKVTGTGGLDIEDLDPRQEALFRLQFPEPLVVVAGGRAAKSPRSFPEASARGVRLRLHRTARLLVPTAERPDAYVEVTRENSLPFEQRFRIQPQSEGGGRLAALAADARRVVPNRVKPSDLDYAAPALGRTVRLDGAATVGELVRRASAATRLELYADARVGRRTVWMRNAEAPVRARDLLGALAQAVSGTFRRVGPGEGGAYAYVLTDDREGIGVRYARLHEWARVSEALRDGWNERADASISEAGAFRHVRFDREDPLAVPDRLVEQFADWLDSPKVSPLGMPVRHASLPASVRDQVAAEDGRAREWRTPYSLDTTGDVFVRMSVELSYVVPGIGQVPAALNLPERETLNRVLLPPARSASVTTLPSPSLPARIPPHTWSAGKGRRRVLLLSPTTAQDARAAPRLAARHGFTEVWLRVPAGGEGAALVRKCLDEKPTGSGAPVPVFAVVSLLRGGAAADCNVLGETSSAYAARRTGAAKAGSPPASAQYVRNVLVGPSAAGGDWARFDSGVAVASLHRGLSEIAAVRGLSGLVLSDTAAPGYGNPASFAWWGRMGNSGDFGYTPGMRLAFLRAAGYDPVDISYSGSNQLGVLAELPFFPEAGGGFGDSPYGTPAGLWAQFRHERNVRLVGETYDRLRRENPSLALYIADDRAHQDYDPAGYIPWDGRAGALPGDDRNGPRPRGYLYAVTVWPGAPGDFLARTLAGADEPSGLVVDLSRVTFSRADAFLKEGVAVRRP